VVDIALFFLFLVRVVEFMGLEVYKGGFYGS
jgi:hypothetical protein